LHRSDCTGFDCDAQYYEAMKRVARVLLLRLCKDLEKTKSLEERVLAPTLQLEAIAECTTGAPLDANAADASAATRAQVARHESMTSCSDSRP
jgi:hypothetical protein